MLANVRRANLIYTIYASVALNVFEVGRFFLSTSLGRNFTNYLNITSPEPTPTFNFDQFGAECGPGMQQLDIVNLKPVGASARLPANICPQQSHPICLPGTNETLTQQVARNVTSDGQCIISRDAVTSAKETVNDAVNTVVNATTEVVNTAVDTLSTDNDISRTVFAGIPLAVASYAFLRQINCDRRTLLSLLGGASAGLVFANAVLTAGGSCDWSAIPEALTSGELSAYTGLAFAAAEVVTTYTAMTWFVNRMNFSNAGADVLFGTTGFLASALVHTGLFGAENCDVASMIQTPEMVTDVVELARTSFGM